MPDMFEDCKFKYSDVLNDTERTEFGSTIRRSDTICLPTTYNIPDVEMERFNEYVSHVFDYLTDI